jgi:hypothetical protein
MGPINSFPIKLTSTLYFESFQKTEVVAKLHTELLKEFNYYF